MDEHPKTEACNWNRFRNQLIKGRWKNRFFHFNFVWVWLSRIRELSVFIQFNKYTCWIRNQKKNGKIKNKNTNREFRGSTEQKSHAQQVSDSGIMIVTDRMIKKDMETVITYHRHPGYLKLNLHRWRRIAQEFSRFCEGKGENFGSNKHQRRWVFDWFTLECVVGCLKDEAIERERVYSLGEWMNEMEWIILAFILSSMLFFLS